MVSKMMLRGKSFALTGAGSGIGLATAKLLASYGASLCLGDIHEESIKAVNVIPPDGTDSHITTFRVDIRSREEVRAFVGHATQQLGQLHGFANIAGTTGKHLSVNNIWEIENSEFRSIFDVNAEGTFNCLAEELKPGVLQSGGSIVNVSSLAGTKGVFRSSVYAASKHAVIGFSKCAALDAGPRNIRVNAVAPGLIDTPMLRGALDNDSSIPTSFTPIARVGKPEEVAHVIVFLLSDQSSFVTGSTYFVDGGWNA